MKRRVLLLGGVCSSCVAAAASLEQSFSSLWTEHIYVETNVSHTHNCAHDQFIIVTYTTMKYTVHVVRSHVLTIFSEAAISISCTCILFKLGWLSLLVS